MAQLGFVGLGIMGAPIAARLLAAGHEVAGYNRTAAKAAALVEAGLRLCESPRAVAENAEIIFSMVSDTAALSAVTQGDHGIIAGLSAGKIYVDLSTVSPGLIRDLATQAEAQGAHTCSKRRFPEASPPHRAERW
jgi:3-hydroxyisobutyrate dehydrogenase-like beta-hydroxyacid dehydrogenase